MDKRSLCGEKRTHKDSNKFLLT